MIIQLFTSPHLVDAILLLTLLEAAVLAYWHRRTGHGLAIGRVLSLLLPGVFILLALRTAMAGASWPWVPASLAAALVAHLVDLRSRWDR